jgi:mono/diheme cytochrome c family protein
MKTRTLLLGLLIGSTAPLAAQQPPALDSAKVSAGKALFEGRGLCFSCHGMHGEGMLGPTTRLDGGKATWLHHDGTLAGVMAVIKAGVDDQKSKSGQIMPPLGGAKLNATQLEQVASYVLHLHRRQPPT